MTSFRKKIYWIAPILLLICIFLSIFLSETSLKKVEEDPFPWCCDDKTDKKDCDDKIQLLSKHVESIQHLKILNHINIVFSIITFGMFSFYMFLTYCFGDYPRKVTFWFSFIYRMFMLSNLCYIISMTSYGVLQLNFAVEDIKLHCILVPTTKRGNIKTEWDDIKSMLHIIVIMFAVLSILEFLCNQLLIQEFYFKKSILNNPKKQDGSEEPDIDSLQQLPYDAFNT